jgi:hypothetical protein
MKKWMLLYTTTSLPQANIVKGMLEENNVPVMMMNKQDSSYVNFGEIELHVPFHLKELARQLLHQALKN